MLNHLVKIFSKKGIKLFCVLILFQFSLALAKAPDTKVVPEEVQTLWKTLSLKEKIAQMIMVYTPSEALITQNQFGAILVMKPHLKNIKHLKEKINNANKKIKIPLLVAIDQEGGFVNRLSNVDSKWENLPSAAEMRTWSPESIDSVAQIVGNALADIGVNINLAPVLDPATDYRGKKTFIEVSQRSWGNLDSSNIEKVSAFVSGLAKSNVYCASKHFPGYDSWTNSDHQIAMSLAPRSLIQKNMIPFKLLAEQTPLIMMSSVRFRKISNTPAVFEKRIISQAKAINPQAIILTDDLWGTSLRSWISGVEKVKKKKYPKADFEKLVLKAFTAGNDMFMITYPSKAVEIIHYLERLAKRYPKYRQRIEESALKIILMKYNHGILQQKDF